MKRLDLGRLRKALADLRVAPLFARLKALLGQEEAAAPAEIPPPPAPRRSRPSAFTPWPWRRRAPEPPPMPPLPPGASFEPAHFACAAGGRDYLTYVPARAARKPRGLVLMLHGCTQNPQDFAFGTRMNDLAETHGLIVVYPQQTRRNNAKACWNWFSAADQQRMGGEPEILAGIAAEVAQAHQVPPGRIYVAGLSAGAAMAVILGETHGDVFAAIGAHSGMPYGAARDVRSALAAMGGRDAAAPGLAVSAPRTIVFQGAEDRVVHPINAGRIAEDLARAAPDPGRMLSETGETGGRAWRREVTTLPDGTDLLETWSVAGLGHAWSGGREGGSFTDPTGPDASAEMVRFFLQRPSWLG